MLNSNLTKAKKAKNDEFYTLYEDIERELVHYENHFKNKVVYCNCDNPYKSNFVKYFLGNFNSLELKGLRATCYSPKGIRQMSLLEDSPEFRPNDRAYFLNVNSVSDTTDIDSVLNIEGNFLEVLKGDGSFDSNECLAILIKSDIVVTNPPFSLFRNFIATLEEYGKQYIVIGPQNAIVYKDIFSLVKNNKLWFGYPFKGGDAFFNVPKDFDASFYVKGIFDKETRKIHFRNCHWFTNLNIKRRFNKMNLVKTYNKNVYPSYDNYDAIEVSKIKDIPCDYDGIMGVPITFLDKYNPEQFEILGMCENLNLYGLKTHIYTTEECKNRYFELFGKKGFYDLNASGVILGKKLYARILIRNRHPKVE